MRFIPPQPLNLSPARISPTGSGTSTPSALPTQQHQPHQPPAGGPIGIQTENGIATAVPIIILPQGRNPVMPQMQPRARISSRQNSTGGSVNQISTDNLTDEQLAELEATERERIFTQLDFLRNVQQQISNVMESMSQYEQILGRMSVSRRSSRKSSPSIVDVARSESRNNSTHSLPSTSSFVGEPGPSASQTTQSSQTIQPSQPLTAQAEDSAAIEQKSDKGKEKAEE